MSVGNGEGGFDDSNLPIQDIGDDSLIVMIEEATKSEEPDMDKLQELQIEVTDRKLKYASEALGRKITDIDTLTAYDKGKIKAKFSKSGPTSLTSSLYKE